jgi:hypothetical protein
LNHITTRIFTIIISSGIPHERQQSTTAATTTTTNISAWLKPVGARILIASSSS